MYCIENKMIPYRSLRVRLSLLSLVLASVAQADPSEVLLPSPGSDAWRPLSIPSVERGTTYQVVGEGASAALRAESRCGASGLAVDLESVDLERTPVLRWQWRVEKGLDIEDEKSRAGDDFAARVVLMFRYDSRQATFIERSLHSLAEKVQGEVLPGRSLAYVWSSRVPEGTVWRNPFRTPTMLISRRRGTTTEWRSESVDVRAEYRRHWGAEPPPLVGLALLTDADNTCGNAVAYYRNFRLTATR